MVNQLDRAVAVADRPHAVDRGMFVADDGGLPARVGIDPVDENQRLIVTGRDEQGVQLVHVGALQSVGAMLPDVVLKSGLILGRVPLVGVHVVDIDRCQYGEVWIRAAGRRPVATAACQSRQRHAHTQSASRGAPGDCIA